MSTHALIADVACPECRTGKHQNCDGGSWHNKTDGPAVCPCFSSGHGADTWQIDERTSTSAPWRMYADRMDRQAAGELAEWLTGHYPVTDWRLQDVSTGEVVHLGRDGKPLPVEVMVPDRRTPEQVMADALADRYEASLERGSDL